MDDVNEDRSGLGLVRNAGVIPRILLPRPADGQNGREPLRLHGEVGAIVEEVEERLAPVPEEEFGGLRRLS